MLAPRSVGRGIPRTDAHLTSPHHRALLFLFLLLPSGVAQFLYHMLDPHYKFAPIGGRDRKSMGGAAREASMKASESMVDAIPNLLKHLAYPYKINRSTVISCGSGSNWPKMLGALHFMLELVTVRIAGGSNGMSCHHGSSHSLL